MRDRPTVPAQACEALRIVRQMLGRSVVGAYLFGSAVTGDLRRDSDVDVLVIVDGALSEAMRRRLVEALLQVSGPIGNPSGLRPVELTVLRLSDIVPWRYPPRQQLVYGEWLREALEHGRIPAPGPDPDLAIVLAAIRKGSVALDGPPAADLLDPVPMADMRRAMRDSLPGLLDNLQGDTRNVLLTLARMWLTAAVADIAPKDVAAEWAIGRLQGEDAALLGLARMGYLGVRDDCWSGKEQAVAELARTMTQAIERCLAGPP